MCIPLESFVLIYMSLWCHDTLLLIVDSISDASGFPSREERGATHGHPIVPLIQCLIPLREKTLVPG